MPEFLQARYPCLACLSLAERLNLGSAKSASARLLERTRTHSQDSKNEPR
jgi:hypothetical protein